MSAPELPGLPRDAAGEPVFPGAWQARAFALALALNQRGVFGWPEFAAALGAELARDGGDYWAAWLRALEARLAAAGVAAPQVVAAMTGAWLAAAARTPHGQPIVLPIAPGA